MHIVEERTSGDKEIHTLLVKQFRIYVQQAIQLELVIFITYLEFGISEIAIPVVTICQPFEAISYHSGIGGIGNMMRYCSVRLEAGLYIFMSYNIIFSHPSADIRYNSVGAPTG